MKGKNQELTSQLHDATHTKEFEDEIGHKTLWLIENQLADIMEGIWNMTSRHDPEARKKSTIFPFDKMKLLERLAQIEKTVIDAEEEG